MNFKRRKPRRKVRCQLCTDNRNGNSAKDMSGRGGGGARKRARVGATKFRVYPVYGIKRVVFAVDGGEWQ